jgi:hypothetical protein
MCVAEVDPHEHLSKRDERRSVREHAESVLIERADVCVTESGVGHIELLGVTWVAQPIEEPTILR